MAHWEDALVEGQGILEALRGAMQRAGTRRGHDALALRRERVVEIAETLEPRWDERAGQLDRLVAVLRAVQEAGRRAEALHAELQAARTQQARDQKDAERARAALAEADGRLAALQSELRDRDEALRHAVARESGLRGEVEVARDTAEARQFAYERASRELDAARSEVHRLREELGRAREDSAQLLGEQEGLRGDLVRSEALEIGLRHSLTRAVTELVDVRSRLARLEGAGPTDSAETGAREGAFASIPVPQGPDRSAIARHDWAEGAAEASQGEGGKGRPYSSKHSGMRSQRAQRRESMPAPGQGAQGERDATAGRYSMVGELAEERLSTGTLPPERDGGDGTAVGSKRASARKGASG